MNQKRMFFHTLHYARRLQLQRPNKILRRAMLTCYQYGYVAGWMERNTDAIIMDASK